MSRLLLDDRFMVNPKIRALDDREFRVWVGLLCLSVEADDPRIAASDVAPEHLKRFAALRLLDRLDSTWYAVHDWAIYNGSTVDDRVSAYLSAHPTASANEVVRNVPVARQAVLAAVRRYRANGSGEPA